MHFLPKDNCISKDASTRDSLTHCVDLRPDASIRKPAIAAGDGLVSRDLVEKCRGKLFLERLYGDLGHRS